MRLSRPAALWLAAALSVGTARGENITFTNGFDGTNGAAVFASNSIQPHTFNWQVDGGNSIQIGTVKLYVANTVVGTAAPATVVPMSIQTESVTSSTSTPTKPWLQSPEARAIVIVGDGALMKDGLDGTWGKSDGLDTEQSLIPDIILVTQSLSTGIITLTDIQALLAQNYGGKEMYFELDWAKPSGGKSYSRAFTVAAEVDAQNIATNPVFTNTTAVHPEVPADDSNGGGGVPESASSTASTTPVATGQGLTPTITGKPLTSNPATSSSSGLATGAKIGIGVGVSLGALLLLGALAFFLLKRRRRSTRHDSAYLNSGHGGHHTPELIAQKEANAGVSPHSPYSDDGRTPLPAHPPAMSQTYDRASLDAPGSVRDGRDSVSVRGVDASGRGSRGGAVSHLVEEGMTEAEIQRLEEEERELDQAIEQAGAGRVR